MSGLDRNGRTGGRVVSGTNGVRSIRPDDASRVRSTGVRYSRPSSTRPNSYRNTGAFDRMNQNNSNRMNGFDNSRTNSSVRTNRVDFGGGSYRTTISGGGGSSSRGVSTGGGGGARRR